MAAKRGPKAPVTAPPLAFDDLPADGPDRIVQFCEKYLIVPKGVGAGEPLRLRDWQTEIVEGLFPVSDRPRQGLLSLPRGNGKSGFAAALGVYALLADNEPGAQVLVVASDERQAGIVYKAAARMIELNPVLAEQVQFYRDRIYVPHTDSEFRTLPAEPGALQGWDPSLLIVDELHVVTRDVWEAVTGAAGKREKSLTLAISTPADSSDSVMWSLVEYGRAEDDPSFYFREFAAPDGCDLDDETAWEIANPALDDFLQRDALRAVRRTMREPAFRRYRLGQWTGQIDTWLPFGSFQECRSDREVPDGTKIVLAFDGSASGDSTALVGCTVGTDPHLFVVGCWNNPGDRGWRVPRADVTAAVADAFARYDVVELAADPWGWRSELEDWATRHGARRVIEWNTANAARMAPATDRFYAAVIDHDVTHDGNQDLETHVGNCVAKSTPQGDLVSKVKKHSARKIDSAVAAIVALDRAAFHSKKRRRVASF